MEKTKEMTLKQRLQNLSEEPTPFFHSLTPFAAGFTQGFNYEKKRLVAALVNNSEVTKDFINEPISLPISDSILFMHAFIDGSIGPPFFGVYPPLTHIVFTDSFFVFILC